MKRSLMITRSTYGRSEDPDCVNWLCQSYVWANNDPTVTHVGLHYIDDTPTHMVRNAAVEVALANDFDYLCMVDSDMAPDLPYEGAKPFLQTAWGFALNHDGPCVIGAPYCSAPPNEKVLAYRWNQRETGDNTPVVLEEYGREEAASKTGFERVAALATGLLLIDLRAVRRLEPPYFDYEWSNPKMCRKVSTEDIYFSRDLAVAGIPCYVAWDSWAGHWKRKKVGKPEIVDLMSVPSRLGRICGIQPQQAPRPERQPEPKPETSRTIEAQADPKPDGPFIDPMSQEEVDALCELLGDDPATVRQLVPKTPEPDHN